MGLSTLQYILAGDVGCVYTAVFLVGEVGFVYTAVFFMLEKCDVLRTSRG